MATQHTPGPWTYACDSYHSSPCLGKTRHSKKAVVYHSNPTGTSVTIASHVANWNDAKLIAAAPDLLEACQQVSDALTCASRVYGNNLNLTAGMLSACLAACAALAKAQQLTK